MSADWARLVECGQTPLVQRVDDAGARTITWTDLLLSETVSALTTCRCYRLAILAWCQSITAFTLPEPITGTSVWQRVSQSASKWEKTSSAKLHCSRRRSFRTEREWQELVMQWRGVRGDGPPNIFKRWNDIIFGLQAFCSGFGVGDIHPQMYPGRIIHSDWNVDLKHLQRSRKVRGKHILAHLRLSKRT